MKGINIVMYADDGILYSDKPFDLPGDHPLLKRSGISFNLEKSG
jgi:hypothetical protein